MSKVGGMNNFDEIKTGICNKKRRRGKTSTLIGLATHGGEFGDGGNLLGRKRRGSNLGDANPIDLEKSFKPVPRNAKMEGGRDLSHTTRREKKGRYSDCTMGTETRGKRIYAWADCGHTSGEERNVPSGEEKLNRSGGGGGTRQKSFY